MGLLAFRTAVKPPLVASVAATSTSQLDPTWTLPAGFSIVLTELEFSLNGSTGWTPIYSGTALTFAHTGRSPNTTYYYRARVKDGQGNYSLYSSVASQTTPSGNFVKYITGHGMIVQPIASASDPGFVASQITALSSEPNIKFVLLRIYWAALEPSRDVYNFQIIEDFLAVCASAGKKGMIQIQDRTFAGATASGILPAYLSSEPGASGGWFLKPNNGGVVSRLWLSPVMARLIKLSQAMALVYDTNTTFHGLVSEESSPGVLGSPAPADYSAGALSTQLKLWMTSSKLAWTHTNVFAALNFLSGQMEGLVAHAVSVGCGISGPDTVPTPAPPDPGFGTQAQRVFLGYREDGSAGGIDYRGKVPALWQVQTPELGGKEGTFTMAQIGNTGASYGGTQMGWIRTTQAPPRPNWPNDELPYLQGSPAALSTVIPDCYAGYLIVTS